MLKKFIVKDMYMKDLDLLVKEEICGVCNSRMQYLGTGYKCNTCGAIVPDNHPNLELTPLEELEVCFPPLFGYSATDDNDFCND
jgi:tRNA(Ile2) C34 agmatinyltransferase TiaS